MRHAPKTTLLSNPDETVGDILPGRCHGDGTTQMAIGVAGHRLRERLPDLAKDRTGTTALFVNPIGSVKEMAK